ncbi:glycosyltransferase family 87 protein [Sphingobium sp. HBC34]|uniref:Glycosyltransferase family 87 protein n=1 Tax=Sphingobium cyanobacteriorum TaxID=3063954 RepID=A0ABT8ZNU6_9SPHN|nr:glycosyltransferase family 87 protein [Sphingobium sp. HBC34]MDO7835881.1 glycosyltransferase family 87 protein [Sphingobium sp. HBC34]
MMRPDRLTRLARLWCMVAGVLLILYLARQWRVGMTDGLGHPFGEDFLNFWSGARLALTGHADAIYDLARFHAFETGVVGAPIDLYHYSYPPVMWLVSAPIALLPYPIAWAVWQGAGWVAFATAMRRIAPGRGLLIALSLPAVFINAMGGQNGCWTAAILGWGLILIDRRPVVAGAILSLFVVKPQLGWLIPLALLAGRHYRATAAFALTAVLLVAATLPLYGIEPWMAYARQAAMLKQVILEDGSGTWHRMLSVFVAVRHLGAPLALAYAAQAVASGAVALMVASLWRREGSGDRAKAVLATGVLAGSLYVSDYDLVIAGLPAVWLWPIAGPRLRGWIALATLTPLAAASLALTSGIALGAAMLWPMMVGAVFLCRPGLRDRATPSHL